MVTVEVQQTGTVSRVCLVTEWTRDLLPPTNDSTPSTAGIVARSMQKSFDRLCASLTSTIREVVIAVIRPEDDPAVLAGVKGVERAMYDLRNNMPTMARQRRLAFRLSKQTWDELHSGQIFHTALEDVFTHESRYWTNVSLDD